MQFFLKNSIVFGLLFLYSSSSFGMINSELIAFNNDLIINIAHYSEGKTKNDLRCINQHLSKELSIKNDNFLLNLNEMQLQAV